MAKTRRPRSRASARQAARGYGRACRVARLSGRPGKIRAGHLASHPAGAPRSPRCRLRPRLAAGALSFCHNSRPATTAHGQLQLLHTTTQPLARLQRKRPPGMARAPSLSRFSYFPAPSALFLRFLLFLKGLKKFWLAARAKVLKDSRPSGECYYKRRKKLKKNFGSLREPKFLKTLGPRTNAIKKTKS